MKRWSARVCVVFALIASSAIPACAQAAAAEMTSGPALEAALVTAIKAYDEAQVHGDRAALDRLVADDYLIVRPRGTGDKASLLANMAKPGMKLEPYIVQKPFRRNFGTTVVIGGWVELRGTDAGEKFTEKFRFSDVWVKRGGKWFVVMTQLTPSDAP